MAALIPLEIPFQLGDQPVDDADLTITIAAPEIRSQFVLEEPSTRWSADEPQLGWSFGQPTVDR